MAQYTREEIESRIDSQLADNSSQDITAADVRGVLKDYMTASMYSPVMIYSGIIKNAPFGTTGDYVKELYFNPDYFETQNETSPTSSSNIYQLSSVSVPGAANGTSTYFPSGGNGQDLVISITVSANLITNMVILRQGAGYVVGDTLSVTVGGTSLTITYNGAIRHSSGSTFTMTTSLGVSHKENNTIVSATPKDITIGNAEQLEMSSYISATNTIILKLEDDNDPKEQHVQLYRIAGIL